jgi:putative NADH-flavin reductase
MPVIVVGADTPLGEAIVAALVSRGGETRAFVTDPERAVMLRALGAKVAVGDLSDGSHVGAAAYNTFTAVIVEESVFDGRQYSFASDATGVLETWVGAVRDSRVQRVIWVGDPPPSLQTAPVPEIAVITRDDRSDQEVALEVADLNDRATLLPEP